MTSWITCVILTQAISERGDNSYIRIILFLETPLLNRSSSHDTRLEAMAVRTKNKEKKKDESWIHWSRSYELLIDVHSTKLLWTARLEDSESALDSWSRRKVPSERPGHDLCSKKSRERIEV